MRRLTYSVRLDTDQFAGELRAAGVPRPDRLVVEADQTIIEWSDKRPDADTVDRLVRVHSPSTHRQLEGFASKAVDVLAGSSTFTREEVQTLLALLVKSS